MTNIWSLPQAKITAFVGSDEDFALGLAFTVNGAALDLSGISFALTIAGAGAVSTANGEVTDPSGNLIALAPAAVKAAWPSGRYTLSLLATDGTYSRDLLVRSTLTVGQPGAPILLAVGTNAGAVALLTEAQIGALLTSGGGASTSGVLDFSIPGNPLL